MEFWAWTISNNAMAASTPWQWLENTAHRKDCFRPPKPACQVVSQESLKSVGKRHHIPKQYNGTSKSPRPKTVVKIWLKEYNIYIYNYCYQDLSHVSWICWEKKIHYSTKSPFHGTLGTSWLRSWRGFGPHHTAGVPRLHGDFKAKSRSDVVGSHHNISIIHLCIVNHIYICIFLNLQRDDVWNWIYYA